MRSSKRVLLVDDDEMLRVSLADQISAGGLYDTVEPWDPVTARGTGFRFDNPDGTGLMWALDQALGTFKDREAWEQLVRNGMEKDFSWDRSAEAYVDVYRRAMEKV